MGSVYMTTCIYETITPVPKILPTKEIPSDKKIPSVGGIHLKEGALLVKFGISSSHLTNRVDRVTGKFSGMVHQRYAYYDSKHYERIEKCLHAWFEKKHVANLWSRLNKASRASRCSQEHFQISTEEALSAFKKAIEKIEGFDIKWIERRHLGKLTYVATPLLAVDDSSCVDQ